MHSLLLTGLAGLTSPLIVASAPTTHAATLASLITHPVPSTSAPSPAQPGTPQPASTATPPSAVAASTTGSGTGGDTANVDAAAQPTSSVPPEVLRQYPFLGALEDR